MALFISYHFKNTRESKNSCQSTFLLSNVLDNITTLSRSHFLGALLDRPPPLGFPVVLGQPPAFPGPIPAPAPGRPLLLLPPPLEEPLLLPLPLIVVAEIVFPKLFTSSIHEFMSRLCSVFFVCGRIKITNGWIKFS